MLLTKPKQKKTQNASRPKKKKTLLVFILASYQMSKDATYYLHQTPTTLAHDLLQTFTFHEDDVLLEPFKGEGAFYNAFPSANTKLWAEITDRKSTRLNSSHVSESRMPSSA